MARFKTVQGLHFRQSDRGLKSAIRNFRLWIFGPISVLPG
jgi:hypothetical protein